MREERRWVTGYSASANVVLAWKRVKANRGSAGVDGRTIAETAAYLKTDWPRIREALIDPTFSEHSYGFRPGRRGHDAVLQAQHYVQDGYRVVVDVDLEKFFDRTWQCPLVHEACSKRSGCSLNALMRKPLRRPWQTRTASSSPRLTRCNTVPD